MLLRLIIIILIILNYKKIIIFFDFKNLNNLKEKVIGIKESIDKYDLNNVLKNIKDIDKNIYKDIKKRTLIINNIYNKIINEKKIIKPQYESIKYEGKNILNILTTMRDIENKEDMIKIIYNYINIILDRILSFRTKNINWFEKDIIEPYDSKINYNYDIY